MDAIYGSAKDADQECKIGIPLVMENPSFYIYIVHDI